MSSNFPYKHILVIGATAGIGRGMAERMVEGGAKVTIVGRRKERLDEFVQKHGADKAQSITYDMSDLSRAAQFAQDVFRTSPDIDAVYLNAGMQHAQDLTSQEGYDIGKFQQEMHINYMCHVVLAKAFLPFLEGKKGPVALIL